MKLIFPDNSIFTESDPKNASKCEENCDTELIPTEQSDLSVSKIQSILTLIENLWQKAIAYLIEETELNVSQEKDRYERIDWHEYDPWTSECFLRDRFLRDQLNDLNH
jgi:hypothetical protein